MAADPNLIKLIHNAIHHNWIIRENTRFKISSMLTLCTHTRTREIGTSGIRPFPVNNYAFEAIAPEIAPAVVAPVVIPSKADLDLPHKL